MQSAISTGIFNPGTFAIPFNCPTGNCTFPGQYHSVGYCSSCIDISADVKLTSDPTLNFTLASGLWANAQFAMTMGPANSEDIGNSAYQVLVALSNYTSNLFLDTCPASHAWACRGYGAAQCSLFPCIRTFEGTVKGGNLTEVSRSSSANWALSGAGDSDQSSVDMACLKDTEKQSLRSAGYQFNNDTQWLAYNVSMSQNLDGTFSFYASENTSDPKIVPAKCIYQISNLASLSLNDFFGTYFSGTLEVGVSSLYGSSMLQAIWDLGNVNFDSVQAIFSNVADSMTASIRQSGVYSLAGYATGAVNQEETCVRPQWAWMAFPLALSACTLVFFVAVVAGTRRRGTEGPRNYKSSVLPLVYHSLDKSVQDDYGKINRPTEEAKQLYVRLSPTDRGWKFVEVALKPTT
jgi:hypothetical protein